MGSVGKSVSLGGGTPTDVTPTSDESTQTNEFDNALSLDGLSSSQKLAEVQRLQSDMGQTGYEAGDPNAYPNRNKLYVKTSKAFDINYYLATGKVGSPNSNWTSLGYTERMIKNDINRIDSGMRPMSEPVLAYRYVTLRSASRMLGMSENDLGRVMVQLNSNPNIASSFGDVLRSTNYTQSAYSSFSYDKRHGLFDSYPIRLRTVIRQGTDAIVTNNHVENEIITHRGSHYNFTGNARLVTEYSKALGKNHTYLEIDVTV